jgi:hypothetical protein
MPYRRPNNNWSAKIHPVPYYRPEEHERERRLVDDELDQSRLPPMHGEEEPKTTITEMFRCYIAGIGIGRGANLPPAPDEHPSRASLRTPDPGRAVLRLVVEEPFREPPRDDSPFPPAA